LLITSDEGSSITETGAVDPHVATPVRELDDAAPTGRIDQTEL
jgi:hypothetical protein